jgi:glycosyltransferase involved in cell wall biosynthesis
LSITVSVVTPSLNQVAFIGDTLESVLGQTGARAEYLVLDGGSVDGTSEKIRSVADRLAFFRSAPDDGQAAAINDGFARSTGEVLCWLNSDDMLLPGALEFVARTLDPSEPQLVFGNCLHIVDGFADAHGSDTVARSASDDLRYHDYIIQPAAFWTRKLWERTGPLDETLTWVFDWDWFIRAQNVASRFEAVVRYLAVYRKHEAHKTAMGGDLRAAEIEKVLRRYAGDEAASASAVLWANRAQVDRWNRLLNRPLVRRFRPQLVRWGVLRDFRHLGRDQLRQIGSVTGVRVY